VYVARLHADAAFDGVIGCGGSGGTSMVCAVMRALPHRVAKVCLSTVASGDCSQYIGGSNLVMIPSLVDLTGTRLNTISHQQLCMAAGALVGMIQCCASTPPPPHRRPVVLASMFGNTTKCITQCQEMLDTRGFETLVFHAVGSGGRTLERMATDSGEVVGVLDLTTTELADEVVGGVFSAGPERLFAAGRRGVAHVIAPGCIDMVNFHSMAGVPSRLKQQERIFYEWNANIVLMRTNRDDLQQIADWFVRVARQSTGPVAFLLPLRGMSLLSAEGGPFHDPELDDFFFQYLKKSLPPNVAVREVDCAINDIEFSRAAVDTLITLMASSSLSGSLPATSPSPSIASTSVSPPAAAATPPAETVVLEATRVTSSSADATTTLTCPPSLKPKPGSNRERLLTRLRQVLRENKPIIGAGAGTGISAKFEERGGADIIIIYNSGRFRMAGRSSLCGMMPFGNANKEVVEMGHEILGVVEDTPVLAGVCATDPYRSGRMLPPFLEKLKRMGFAGVQNFPTVGLVDGNYRCNLEETGISYALEVEMIRQAASMDLLTTPYAFNAQEARLMAAAGADVVVAHMGLTSKGSIGASTVFTLAECVQKVQEICDAVEQVNPEALVLCHGGPISMPEDAAYILQNTHGVHGFYGASSTERLPTERAITKQLEDFKEISFKK